MYVTDGKQRLLTIFDERLGERGICVVVPGEQETGEIGTLSENLQFLFVNSGGFCPDIFLARFHYSRKEHLRIGCAVNVAGGAEYDPVPSGEFRMYFNRNALRRINIHSRKVLRQPVSEHAPKDVALSNLQGRNDLPPILPIGGHG
jgi:hypothetical protein